jgi:hypothetical protein
MAALGELIPELLSRVCQLIDEPLARKKARRAAALLRGPLTEMTKILHAHRGVLPPKAWEAFANANQLVISFRGTESNDPDMPKAAWATDSALSQRLEELLRGLPQRVTHVALAAAALDRQQVRSMARSLAASPIASTLRSLKLPAGTAVLKSPDFDALMAALPALEELEAAVEPAAGGGEQQQHGPHDYLEEQRRLKHAWAPAALPPQLVALTLVYWLREGTAELEALTGLLAPLARLRQLSLGGLSQVHFKLANVEALAQLGQLRSLHLRGSLAAGEAPSALWRLLQGLPALQYARLPALEVAPSLAPLAPLPALTSLRVEDALTLSHSLPAGYLLRALPSLQALASGHDSDVYRLVSELAGHTALRELALRGRERAPQGWPEPRLCSLPRLARLVLDAPALPDQASLVLEDAARCRVLRQLRFSAMCALPGRALAALGGCRCLERAELLLDLADLAGLAALLQLGGGARAGLLREVRLVVGRGLVLLLQDQRELAAVLKPKPADPEESAEQRARRPSQAQLDAQLLALLQQHAEAAPLLEVLRAPIAALAESQPDEENRRSPSRAAPLEPSYGELLELLAARMQQPGVAALLEERELEAEGLVERARQALQQRHELHAILVPHLHQALQQQQKGMISMEVQVGAVRLLLTVKCY